MCTRDKLQQEAVEFGFSEEKANELVSKQCCKDAQVARLTTALGRLGDIKNDGTWHIFGCRNDGSATQVGEQCNKPCGDTFAAFCSAEKQVEEALKFFLGRPGDEHFSWRHLNIYGECRCPGCSRLRLALGV